MAQELDDGVAYLRALKQATGAQTAATPAPPQELDKAVESASTAQQSESFGGAEKRRSPRYKCEGSAEVREDGCDVRAWATFTDVSLHGCYVEAQATYPAGTLLHMKMEVNGIRFETRGKVRISYPCLGMGIAFEEMSDENVVRLKQLLGTLSRPGVIVGPGANAPHPTTGPMDGIPAVTNPESAVRALIEFFEMHQVLMRDDFLKLVKKSQR
jgi:hypothetical protein